MSFAPVAIPKLELAPPLPRDLCTDCGISRSADPDRCGRACQFIRPDYAALEVKAHGRERKMEQPDEMYFGPLVEMIRARRSESAPGAQWTGITTRLAERLLEEGLVDAVLATTSSSEDRWAPEPVLITRPEELARCRGMKMGFSPILALLDQAKEAGFKRLAVIGIPCQVHALRALEDELGLDALFVIGTPCSDNTTTEKFHAFLDLLTDTPDDVTYLEFCPDYCVEMRFASGETKRIPFLELPISSLPDDFFPLTCKSCMDYVNSLADITVGYLGGDGEQWLLVRNERGQSMLSLIEAEIERSPLNSSGSRRKPVEGFLANVERVAGGLPARRMPDWLRPFAGRMQRWFGPRGLEFARARLEMRALESVVTLRRDRPRLVRWLVPENIWALSKPYGITPTAHETSRIARLQHIDSRNPQNVNEMVH